METAYIDLLLAEKPDGTPALVIADACTAEEGDLVAFCGGVLGRVKRSVWGGERNGALHLLAAELVPVWEAEAVYRLCRKNGGTRDGVIPGAS